MYLLPSPLQWHISHPFPSFSYAEHCKGQKKCKGAHMPPPPPPPPNPPGPFPIRKPCVELAKREKKIYRFRMGFLKLVFVHAVIIFLHFCVYVIFFLFFNI